MRIVTMCLALAAFLAACGEVDKKDETLYTVSFNAYGGTAVASQAVAKGGYATEPAEPLLGEHAFAGWYREAAYQTAWNFASDPVTNDLTLHAQWSRASAGLEYILTNGGTAYAVNWGFFDEALLYVPKLWQGKPVTSIADEAFVEVGSLHAVFLPAGIVFLGKFNFSDAWNMTNFTILAATPPQIDGSNLSNCVNLTAIFVPAGSVNAYKTTGYWTNLASLIQPIP
jgi:uncharacterized repeat protein (TIGR02543 family)